MMGGSEAAPMEQQQYYDQTEMGEEEEEIEHLKAEAVNHDWGKTCASPAKAHTSPHKPRTSPA